MLSVLHFDSKLNGMPLFKENTLGNSRSQLYNYWSQQDSVSMVVSNMKNTKPKINRRVCSFPVAATTKHHRFSGLRKEVVFPVLRFSRLVFS